MAVEELPQGKEREKENQSTGGRRKRQGKKRYSAASGLGAVFLFNAHCECFVRASF